VNIFILSRDPVEAAVWQCNKHVVKMILESAQLLSAAHPADVAPYKHTHMHHPCSKWVRESIENYRWLVDHGLALCAEYTKRYCRVHKTEAVMMWLSTNAPELPPIGLTPFARAIKDPRYQSFDDTVEAYRAYYIAEKAKFARWAPLAETPPWWPHVTG
jgi:hypothetical protein